MESFSTQRQQRQDWRTWRTPSKTVPSLLDDMTKTLLMRWYTSQWSRRMFRWQKIDSRQVIHFWKGNEKCYLDSLKSKWALREIIVMNIYFYLYQGYSQWILRILKGFSSFVFKIEKISSKCDIFLERHYPSLFENVRYICIDIINHRNIVKHWSLRNYFFCLFAIFIKDYRISSIIKEIF